MRIWHLVTLATVAIARDSAHAQEGMISALAIPLVTRANPSATQSVLTEGYVAQPIIMAHGAWGHLRGVTTLNFEGLTLQRGELNTGTYGEGYIDRRHPHTYVHELLAGVDANRGGLRGSFFFGRGFAPFGSDDPMMRPIIKYPINHHLAQVLERVVAVGAVRLGPAIAEFGTFNGDEPISVSEAPNWKRFGDSWSTRFTLLPIPGGEFSASWAHVVSPEVRAGRGLDGRKASVVARYSRTTSNTWRYAFAEWAQTHERDRGRLATSLSSVLAEAAYCRAGIVVAARAEHTDRPEEERGLDPFRSPRPPIDLTNLGVSRWTTFTVSVSPAAMAAGPFSGRPFVEVARATARPGDPPGLFDVQRQYGASRMWTVSAGVRLRAGTMHTRMGRYGAADPYTPLDPPGTSARGMASHHHPQASSLPALPSGRCTL